jgi:hypothetical protein
MSYWRIAMDRNDRDLFDIDQMLHPANAFRHPQEVVNDPDLTLNEKRAILASWASDACAVEAYPALREGQNGEVIKYDEIMEALRALDGQMVDQPKYRKLVRRAEIFKKIAGGHHGGSVPLD